jgi:hypothetical protein
MVSQGSTDYVGLGVVVIGGAGGGYYVAGGKTYAVDQGQTETAGATSNSPVSTHSTPGSTSSGASTSSSSSSASRCSGSSMSACATVPDILFYDIDLNGLNNQQITSIMGPTDYTPVSIKPNSNLI